MTPVRPPNQARVPTSRRPRRAAVPSCGVSGERSSSLAYAFALVAIVIASLAFVLQLFGADPGNDFAHGSIAAPARHCALPGHLSLACQRQLGPRRVTALRDHHVRPVCAAVHHSSTTSTVGETNPSAEIVTRSNRPRSKSGVSPLPPPHTMLEASWSEWPSPSRSRSRSPSGWASSSSSFGHRMVRPL